IATNGFGDGSNSYAWSCLWYDDHVYIGSNRHLLIMMKKRFTFEIPLAVWPVPVPETDKEIDLRAQIWRYSPKTQTWERVYRAIMTPGLENRMVPVAFGFRNMVSFQGKSDRKPAIYTIPSCGSYGL